MFNDDDQPIAPVSKPGRSALGFSDAGKASVKADHNKQAPLKANTVRVLLDVSSSSSTARRAALDLVVVLDVSGSMADGGKLDQLKLAMQFVIKKLSPMDRLSIVTFSSRASRLCPLRAMSEAAKSDLKAIVDGLAARGGTNIQAGLETGLEVLGSRQYIAGRTVNILLMSDGQENNGDARQVGNTRNVPVYSLAFGMGADIKLLHELAKNGGTFSPVPENGGMDMLAVFSQLMAGLLTVVVQDLQLILSKPTSPDAELDKIVKVAPGDFNQETESQSGTITVKFGDLFSGEVRKVVVDLLLLETNESDYETDILDVAVSYPDAQGARQKFRGQTLHITRTATASSDATTRPLQAEMARRQHADSISAARSLADGKNLEGARDKLVEAQNALEDILDQANPMVGMLRTELQQLLDRMESQELYETEGRPYALASETSHARQRFAARGDVEGVRLFATPRMDAYLEQAKQFAKDPDALLPTADEDAQEEIKANPMAAIAGPLAFYIQAAVQALQAIEKIVIATSNV
ncbi:E3 ubiquitin-protein ligase WAV3-like [Phragmites australis]|uniref:E3 ubiquitin-protein ligase WAV3-like n=1 Tax=Phragmites australis TaxID=29695 RepID=UPI002D79D265|nr:E3 ubiquitin-protein ligase WAV3-like [Phragmites australis]